MVGMTSKHVEIAQYHSALSTVMPQGLLCHCNSIEYTNVSDTCTRLV